MANLLDHAVDVARRLPEEVQEDIARVVLQLAGEDLGTYSLSQSEADAIAISKDAAARGEFATDDQVRAVWRQHGL